MSILLDVIAFIVVAIAIGVTLFYVSKGAADIAKIPNYDKDTNLTLARKYLIWTSVIGWILLAIIVASIIAVFVFGEEIVAVWGGMIILGFIIVMLGFAAVLGGLAAYSAYLIQQTGKQNTPTYYPAYLDAIIAAVVTLGFVGILVLIAIGYGVRKYRRDKELAEAQENLRKLRTEKFVEKVTE